MKLSDYLVNFLVAKKITHVFEVAGGSFAHILDSFYNRKDIKCVSMHHEMASAIAAEGYARVSGNFGVAMATSGPGALNMATGIGSCFFDSVPCIFVTGQVNTYEYKFKKLVRQIGFQETDIVSVVKPITKSAIMATNPKKIKYYLEKLVCEAKTNRPGPVLFDVPMNIQRADVNESSLKGFVCEKRGSINPAQIKKIKDLIEKSSRPVILVGGGIRAANAADKLAVFVKRTGIPVVASLMGIDAFTQDNDLFVGMLGTYGNRYANLAVANSDLLLVLGSRLDTRQTGTKPKSFARAAKIIHVDIDSHELNNKVAANVAVRADLKDFLSAMNRAAFKIIPDKFNGWKKRIQDYKKQYPSFKLASGEKIEPNFLMHKLSKFLPQDAIVCVDVGQNQMWAAQSLVVKKNQRFLTQGGMASIGSALPMAIGASFARPKSMVVVISGDGGFQLNSQELQTVFYHNLPIKILLLNNHCYGMVRQFQTEYFNSKFQSTVAGYNCPDWQKVVRAYNISSARLSKNSEIDRSFKKLFLDKKPGFLEVEIDKSANITPKLGINKPIEEQYPALPAGEFEKNMIIKPLKR